MSQEKKKKSYEFALLARRPTYVRFDILSVLAITATLIYQFGWSLTDKEDLLAMGMMVLTVMLDGVLLLCNHWSVAYHETIAYKNLQPN